MPHEPRPPRAGGAPRRARGTGRSSGRLPPSCLTLVGQVPCRSRLCCTGPGAVRRFPIPGAQVGRQDEHRVRRSDQHRDLSFPAVVRGVTKVGGGRADAIGHSLNRAPAGASFGGLAVVGASPAAGNPRPSGPRAFRTVRAVRTLPGDGPDAGGGDGLAPTDEVSGRRIFIQSGSGRRGGRGRCFGSRSSPVPPAVDGAGGRRRRLRSVRGRPRRGHSRSHGTGPHGAPCVRRTTARRAGRFGPAIGRILAPEMRFRASLPAIGSFLAPDLREPSGDRARPARWCVGRNVVAPAPRGGALDATWSRPPTWPPGASAPSRPYRSATLIRPRRMANLRSSTRSWKPSFSMTVAR